MSGNNGKGDPPAGVYVESATITEAMLAKMPIQVAPEQESLTVSTPRHARGAAMARRTKFAAIISPDLSVGKRVEVAHQLINRLCEQIYLGGSLLGWQVAQSLAGVCGLWERYPKREAELDRRLSARFERNHVEVCKHCQGKGTLQK